MMSLGLLLSWVAELTKTPKYSVISTMDVVYIAFLLSFRLSFLFGSQGISLIITLTLYGAIKVKDILPVHHV